MTVRVHKKLVRKFTFRISAFAGAAALFCWTGMSPALAAGPDRINGDNRYQTAARVAEQGWPNGAKTVIIVQGEKFADALTGTPLAYQKNAPILLTTTDDLAKATRNEINKLNARNAIILGGPNAVSTHVENQIKNVIPGSGHVKRIAGSNRFETAKKVAGELKNYNKAVVAYGESFPDSLSIASYAASHGYPILLTRTSSIPDATKEALKGVDDTIVVGGPGVVSRRVYNDLKNHSRSPKRYAGDNRYETAQAVIASLYKGSDSAFVSTGSKFADALSGSVLAAKRKEPVVLVQPHKVPKSIRHMLSRQDFNHFTVLGGPTAVSKGTVQDILHPEVKKEEVAKVDKKQEAPKVNIREEIIQDAKALKGVPYRWGGTTPSGFDCSGFVNYVFQKNGINLPRTSSSIWQNTKRTGNLQPGDLVFYNTSGGGVSHVGIYIGHGDFISATSSHGVAIEPVHGKYYWGSRYVGATNPF